jgi:hypothetical protein
MTYATVGCVAIGMDCAENTIPLLLFTGRCLVMAGCSFERIYHSITKVKVKVIYRQSVGKSVLVSGAHLGPAINFSFSLRFSLGSCGFVIL